MLVLGLSDIDTLLDASAVGHTLVIKFCVKDRKTKKNRFEWCECICVYRDDASIAIIGIDGEEYWWSRETLATDLSEGWFKS